MSQFREIEVISGVLNNQPSQADTSGAWGYDFYTNSYRLSGHAPEEATQECYPVALSSTQEEGFYLVAYSTSSPSDTQSSSLSEEDASGPVYLSFEEELSPVTIDSPFKQIQDNFRTFRPLAKGCNGQVSLGCYNGELVAIKQALNPSCVLSLVREINVLQTLRQFSDEDRHFVVELLAVDYLPNPTAAVYRYYGHGHLGNFLDKNTELSFSKRVSLMIDVSSALKFIHGAGILHKDLKAENILIDDDGTPKIADFGCATQENERAVYFGGDTFTLSPKMLENTKTYLARKRSNDPAPLSGLEVFSKADDIYALSLVLYHIMSGQLPFADYKAALAFSSFYTHVVTNKQRPDITPLKKGTAKLITLVSDCWHDSEQKRPDISMVEKTLKGQVLTNDKTL